MQPTSSAKEVPLLSEHPAHGGQLPTQDCCTAACQFSGKTGSGVPAMPPHSPCRSGRRARLHVTTVSSGGEARGCRAAGQVTSRSFLHEVVGSTRRTKQKGAFSSEKEKDITLASVLHCIPDWEVYLMHTGNSISPIAAGLGFLTTVEEL